MAASAADRAWRQSRAKNGSLIVLLAIADECGKGTEVEMSVAQIARKARLGDRATRAALKDLERLGELSVTPRQGGISRYALPPTPADITGVPRQNLPDPPEPTPADSAGPVDNVAKKPQVKATPAESAGPNFSDDLELSPVVSGERSKPSRRKQQPDRPDVDRLCAHLAEAITANGSRPPTVSQKWRDAARLLLDKDGMTEEQVHLAIDWSQKDEFWHRNILSMPKLREKYDQLRLAAQAEQRKKSRPAAKGNPDDDYAAALQRISARKENANGTRGDGHHRAPRQVALPPAAD